MSMEVSPTATVEPRYYDVMDKQPLYKQADYLDARREAVRALLQRSLAERAVQIDQTDRSDESIQIDNSDMSHDGIEMPIRHASTLSKFGQLALADGPAEVMDILTHDGRRTYSDPLNAQPYALAA